MSKIKAWLQEAADITGLDLMDDAHKLARLFNETKGSLDPEVLRNKLKELPGINV